MVIATGGDDAAPQIKGDDGVTIMALSLP